MKRGKNQISVCVLVHSWKTCLELCKIPLQLFCTDGDSCTQKEGPLCLGQPSANKSISYSFVCKFNKFQETGFVVDLPSLEIPRTTE